MDDRFSPVSCRAARALLDLSQAALAKRAGVSRLTVIGFEDGSRRAVRASLRALRSTLEAAGVEFLTGGARLRGEAGVAELQQQPAGDRRLASVLRNLQRAAKRLQRMGVQHVIVFGATARGEA